MILALLFLSQAFAQSLPNQNITPGAINPAITQENIKSTICVPGYTAKVGVRNVSESTKRQVFKNYNLTFVPGKYEVDHLISLELGGSNDIKNLWPEPYEPKPGAHEKDTVENWLHRLVCSGKKSLLDAQNEIQDNWYNVYLQMEK